MVYLDTSVALAHLLAEEKSPPASMWQRTLVASRLMEYELWNRIHARGLGKSHGELVRGLLGQVAILELVAPVLARALEPFPVHVRTLDAIHLASADFLRTQGQTITVATYDQRMHEAAVALGFAIEPL
jgi:predicted nucleic acid-binding protein